jgi:hypothetical protein
MEVVHQLPRSLFVPVADALHARRHVQIRVIHAGDGHGVAIRD